MRTWSWAVIAVAAAALALPSAALAAGTAKVESGTFGFTAGSGDTNHLTVSSNGNTVTFTDTLPITPGTDCAPGANANQAICTSLTANTVRADLGDSGDELTVLDDTPIEANGGSGADTLRGGSGDDELHGDDEHDTIIGNGGDDASSNFNAPADSDAISLGDGDDEVDGFATGSTIDLGPGDDRFQLLIGQYTGSSSATGGPGVDTVELESASAFPGLGVTVNHLAGTYAEHAPGSFTAPLTGFENEIGSAAGGDTVTGTNGANVIDTGLGQVASLFVAPARSGNDVVDPLAGADVVSTGDGNDKITSRDGFADFVNCGSGADTVLADQIDELVGCEVATISKLTPAGTDTTPPVCSFTKAAKKATKASFLKGYSATFKCGENVSVLGRIVVTAKRSKGKTVIARVGDVILAERSTSATAGATKKLTLRVSKKLRSALGKKFTARITIEARDTIGNRRAITRTVKVTTPRKKKKK